MRWKVVDLGWVEIDPLLITRASSRDGTPPLVYVAKVMDQPGWRAACRGFGPTPDLALCDLLRVLFRVDHSGMFLTRPGIAGPGGGDAWTGDEGSG
jgi:hypothetical protein